MIDSIPCLDLYGKGGNIFSRWVYEQVSEKDGQLDLHATEGEVDAHGYRRIDNVTDSILNDYRESYGSQVTKDDIFYYVYGLLHSPNYRYTYEADLTKMLPRIPKVASTEDFHAFSEAGHQLSDLHLCYETIDPYPLTEVVKDGAPTDAATLYRVTKMKYGPGKDKSKLIYNPWITLERVPAEVYEYMLGPRSAIDWLIDRYQIKVDKKSGIINDPNDWATEYAKPRYILDLIKRLTTVSVRTVELVSQLPELKLGNHE